MLLWSSYHGNTLQDSTRLQPSKCYVINAAINSRGFFFDFPKGEFYALFCKAKSTFKLKNSVLKKYQEN